MKLREGNIFTGVCLSMGWDVMQGGCHHERGCNEEGCAMKGGCCEGGFQLKGVAVKREPLWKEVHMQVVCHDGVWNERGFCGGCHERGYWGAVKEPPSYVNKRGLRILLECFHVYCSPDVMDENEASVPLKYSKGISVRIFCQIIKISQ